MRNSDSKARLLLHLARQLGYVVQLKGDRVTIRGPSPIPDELRTELPPLKPELVRLLSQEQRPAGRGGTHEQWRAIARQVKAGEFDEADKSLAEALWIGLRGWPDELCREAAAVMRGKMR